jgi:hypothetical protein
MATTSLLSTAPSTNDLPSIFSHLPSYYQKSAEEQLRSAGGEDALSTFKRCSEYADSYAQSFDEKTYRSFDARYSDLIQQIDLQVCMEVPCFEEGRERFNHTMTDFWECMEVPKVIRAFFLKTKPPPDQNEAVMLAMGSLLHADQSCRGDKERRENYKPKLLEDDRLRLAKALVAVGAQTVVGKNLFLYYLERIRDIHKKEQLEAEKQLIEQEQTEKKRRLEKMELKDFECSSGEEEEKGM